MPGVSPGTPCWDICKKIQRWLPSHTHTNIYINIKTIWNQIIQYKVIKPEQFLRFSVG